ncbi:isopenicillin N synthase family oxygenase [Bacteriovoracaceae bacterium]|nr:isopenicillin N synthase family oxygenase [Bacteriovoracaceae bacterium]
MTNLTEIPKIDLNHYISGNLQQQNKFVDSLYEGLVEFGFCILTGHNISEEIIDDGYSAVKEYFSLPTKTKINYTTKEKGGQRGYTGFGKEHAKNQEKPDLKEFWHVGRELESDHPYIKSKKYLPNLWPTEVQNFKPALTKLYNSLDNASQIILEALSNALKIDPEIFRNMLKDGNSILRPLHYPPLKGLKVEGAIRAAAHEDINLITLLMGATGSGLQLLDRNNQWMDIETKPGQIIVDSGDMLSRITGGHIPATTHRVINPSNDNSSRFSMPFFVHPHPDAILETLPITHIDIKSAPPINSLTFLHQRLEEIGLMD